MNKFQIPSSKLQILRQTHKIKFQLLFGTWCLVLGILYGCSTSFDGRGVFHKVRKGDTLYWVAKSYGVNLQDLAEMNDIRNAEASLTEGEKLYIPSRRTHRFKKLPFEGQLERYVTKKPEARTRGRKKIKEEEVVAKGKDVYTDPTRFEWPLEGAVISPFGVRRGRRHDGVDIKGVIGTPIKVAGEGQIVFSGRMRGYGNLILVRHADDFFTAYAHNQMNLAKEGEKVKKGEVIGRVGRTGRATGPHLHFEVREGEKARNPLFFLPVVR